MAREVCEVITSNEVLNRQFGGPGIEVEVDECFLTRHKYHKGANLLRLCTRPDLPAALGGMGHMCRIPLSQLVSI